MSINSQLKFKSDPIKLIGHQKCVMGVVISSDDAIIASGSLDDTVKLWNAKTKQLIQTFHYTGRVQGGVAMSSNNRYLAFGGCGNYSIHLQDLQSNKRNGTLMGHTRSIQSIVFSSDSQFLFSGGNDQKLIVWNINQKKQIHSLETDSLIWVIATSSDNKLISCICVDSINIWDFQTKGKLIYLYNFHQYGKGLCFSKDSSFLISSGNKGQIHIWKLNHGEKNNQKSLTLTREIKAAYNQIQRVILTSDEKYIISICNEEEKIMIHRIESGNLIQELKHKYRIFERGYISISNDMNFLVSSGDDKLVKIWTRE